MVTIIMMSGNYDTIARHSVESAGLPCRSKNESDSVAGDCQALALECWTRNSGGLSLNPAWEACTRARVLVCRDRLANNTASEERGA
jgi:hypothetical protein